MKKLFIISVLACLPAWAMCPAAVTAVTRRAFSSQKIYEHAIKNPRSTGAWKHAYQEYQKAVIDREKCKAWKQIGYGIHDGYCTNNKVCSCTYSLVQIAKNR